MNLNELSVVLIKLDKLKYLGGKSFKEATEILSREATTENISEAVKLLKTIEGSTK